MRLRNLKLLSPNYDKRPTGSVIDTLVLHYTGMKSAKEALERLCDLKAKVSAHYIIDEDGAVTPLVDEQYRAWHAGISFWRGKTGINDCSIGIELVNPGHEFGYLAFLPAQMDALINLCQEILKRHPIAARNVVGHSDIAPDRKNDPGELFDWQKLAQNGIGLWYDQINIENQIPTLKSGDTGKAVLLLQQKLADFGYNIKQSGVFDKTTEQVIIAFRRHFLPDNITSMWNTKIAGILDSLQSKVANEKNQNC